MYTLLYQPGHKGALFVLKSEHISTKTHPCVEACILSCVLKTNKAFTGSERHRGK